MPGGRGARKKGQHGGYRAPAKPAAVSGPGALARRTDGGPAQPVRPIPSGGPGATNGDRASSVALQEAAPLGVDEPPAGPPPPAAQPAPIAAGGPPVDPFGPTRRPDEPVTAGATLGAGRAPNAQQDARDVLGQLYAEFQLDEMLEMLEELDEELEP